MDLLNDDEYTVVEDRGYINPQVSLDESNRFIDQLRSTQQANTQQIQTDTYNLGTAVPSNLGGLTSPVGANGAGNAGLSYWTSRYQTPQTNSAVANLRATAQAQALSQALENEQAKWKKRYNDAYRAYQKRAASSGGGSSGGSDGDIDGDSPIYESTTTTIEGVVPGLEGGYTVGDFVPGENGEEGSVTGYTYVPYGEDGKTNYTSSPVKYSSSFGTDETEILRNYKDESGHWGLEYRLPSGKTTFVKWGEVLQKGTDGDYYVYNRDTGVRTHVGR